MKTISLELAKRLKEAGFMRESARSWLHSNMKWVTQPTIIARHNPTYEQYPAYDFEELWAMLPDMMPSEKREGGLATLCMIKRDSTFVGYHDRMNGHAQNVFESNSPTEAAGLLLEWAIKEGHVK